MQPGWYLSIANIWTATWSMLEVHVYTEALPSSANADLMLDTTFTDAEALKGYSTHPAHVAVANGKVRPYTAVRTCLDFTV